MNHENEDTNVLDSNSQNTPPPTEKTDAEYNAEIQRLRTEQATANLKRAEVEQENQKRMEDLRQSNARVVYREQLKASGLEFYEEDADMLVNLLSQVGGYNIQLSNTGREVRVVSKDGRELTLAESLAEFGKSRRHLVKTGLQVIDPRDAQGKFKPLSKDMFKTTAEKASYISREGLSAWENLPLHSPQSLGGPHQMGRSAWSKLTGRQKADIVNEWGSGIVSEVLRRP